VARFPHQTELRVSNGTRDEVLHNLWRLLRIQHEARASNGCTVSARRCLPLRHKQTLQEPSQLMRGLLATRWVITKAHNAEGKVHPALEGSSA